MSDTSLENISNTPNWADVHVDKSEGVVTKIRSWVKGFSSCAKAKAANKEVLGAQVSTYIKDPNCVCANSGQAPQSHAMPKHLELCDTP